VRALPRYLVCRRCDHRSRHSASDVDAGESTLIIGGSQKALMIPPGLAYGAISERLGNAWRQRNLQVLLRPAEETEIGGQGETAYTPALSLFADCGGRFDYLRQMGTAILRRVAMRSSRTRSWCACDDSRRRRSAGPEVILAELSGGPLTAVRRRRAADSKPFANAFAMNLARL